MTVKSCEKKEKSIVALTIEVGAEEFEKAVNKAYLKIRGQISIPGFRPGKAPRKIIEQRYGAGVFYEDAVNESLPEIYEAALKEADIKAVGYPEVNLDDVSANGYTVTFNVPVYPEVKLGQYKGLEAPMAEVKVAAADVNARLKSMAERNSRMVSVERAAKNGDTANIDFEGFESGVAFEGGKGENYDLVLGSGSFIPGFEDQVVGMKAGEEKEINVTFPEDYTAELAGKAAMFKVKVNEVKEKEIPAIDDEFAKDVSEFDTLKDLKADLKKKITEERKSAAKQAFEDKLMEMVSASIEADIPEAMIANQAQNMVDQFKSQIASSGMKFEDYLKYTGSKEEDLVKQSMETAEQQVRAELAIDAIVKAENIEASDDEVEEEYKKIAEQYSIEIENMKKYVPAEDVKQQIIREKATKVVFDSAKATAPVEEKAEEAAEEEKPAKKPAAKKTTKKAEKAE